jgi:hypothetical protein
MSNALNVISPKPSQSFMNFVEDADALIAAKVAMDLEHTGEAIDHFLPCDERAV